MFLRNVTFNGLHSVISQKIQLFITTAVRNSKNKHFNSDKYLAHKRA
jgi:hypothetical protein